MAYNIRQGDVNYTDRFKLIVGALDAMPPAIFVRNVRSIKIDVQKIYMDLKFGTCTKSTVLFGGRVTFVVTTCIS